MPQVNPLQNLLAPTTADDHVFYFDPIKVEAYLKANKTFSTMFVGPKYFSGKAIEHFKRMGQQEPVATFYAMDMVHYIFKFRVTGGFIYLDESSSFNCGVYDGKYNVCLVSFPNTSYKTLERTDLCIQRNLNNAKVFYDVEEILTFIRNSPFRRYMAITDYNAVIDNVIAGYEQSVLPLSV